jgi:hypothetical protein
MMSLTIQQFNSIQRVGHRKQSVFGRMFDFGTVTILSTGEGIETLPTIAGPIRLRNSIVVGT